MEQTYLYTDRLENVFCYFVNLNCTSGGYMIWSYTYIIYNVIVSYQAERSILHLLLSEYVNYSTINDIIMVFTGSNICYATPLTIKNAQISFELSAAAVEQNVACWSLFRYEPKIISQKSCMFIF